MAVESNGQAPYAPTSAVLGVIESFRERSPKTPFTVENLALLSISESLAPRTLQALKLLDLVDQAGDPLPVMVQLREAPQNEFKDRLAAVVRAAYAEVFAYRDPVTDDPAQIIDSFRRYRPPSMRDRMVRLFYGLCEAAGIIDEAPTIENAPKPPGVQGSRPRPPKPAKPSTPPAEPQEAAGVEVNAQREDPPPIRRQSGTDHLHLALIGLLSAIPPSDEPWSSAERREAFKRAWDAALEIANPVPEPSNA